MNVAAEFGLTSISVLVVDDGEARLEPAEDHRGEACHVAEEKLRQMQAELTRAQGDRAAKQSKYELASSAPAESLPEVLDDPYLKDYQVKLTDLARDVLTDPGAMAALTADG